MSLQKIIILLGSTKPKSSNAQIVDFIIQHSSAHFEAEILNMTNLPYFNPDVNDDLLPSEVGVFREKVKQADGVLICTPEYVFSIPGILKNALEWMVSTTIFEKKPTAIITAAASGEMAHDSIQLIMNTLGASINPNCTILIKSPKAKIEQNGQINDPDLRTQLLQLISNLYGQINEISLP